MEDQMETNAVRTVNVILGIVVAFGPLKDVASVVQIRIVRLAKIAS